MSLDLANTAELDSEGSTITPGWLRNSVAHLREGSLLAYPTETSWGLGADAAQPAALERLRRFKGDRGMKPFSILVRDFDALDTLGFAPSSDAALLAERFWPGPLTLVLPCRAPWARQVGREDGAVAVRCSPHPVAGALASAFAAAGLGPLTATSLNRSGQPPARRRSEAEELCHGGDCVLAAPRDAEAGGAAESTIVDLGGARPVLLRAGAVSADQLARWLPAAREAGFAG